MSGGYVDSDGHVMEDAEDLIKFVRPPFDNRGTRNWLPSLDHFHTPADLPEASTSPALLARVHESVRAAAATMLG